MPAIIVNNIVCNNVELLEYLPMPILSFAVSKHKRKLPGSAILTLVFRPGWRLIHALRQADRLLPARPLCAVP